MEQSLSVYASIVFKRRWIALVVFVSCLVGGAVATFRMTPVYEGTTQLFVGQRQVAQTDVLQGQTVAQLSSELLKSYARIIGTRPIIEQAIGHARLPLTVGDVTKSLSADPVLDTQIIELSFRSINPHLAAATVNSIADTFVSEIQKIEVPVQGDSRPAIKVSVVEPATAPSSPVSPKPVLNFGLATVLGLLLGVGAAFLVEQLDTTIKNKRDMKGITLPVLVEIPSARSNTVAVQDADGPIGEAFRRLRATISFIDVDESVKSLLVTSPQPSDGKSTVALNLAIAYAQAQTRTVLVEADLRNPTLQTIFRVDGKPGLAHLLSEERTASGTVIRTPLPSLFVLPAGACPPNPSELLASERMRWVIDQLAGSFACVIIDSAPLLPVADSMALCTRVDGVLLVARGRQTKRRPLEEAADAVQQVGGKLLGVVLNGVKPERGASGYYPYPSPYVRRPA